MEKLGEHLAAHETKHEGHGRLEERQVGDGVANKSVNASHGADREHLAEADHKNIGTKQLHHHDGWGGGVFISCINVALRQKTKTIDPRIPYCAGTEHVGFYQSGRHRVNQARSAVRCSASRMKGELSYILLRTTCGA